MSSGKDDFYYEIVEAGRVLSTDNKGFRKEVNIIAFNGKDPVIDIRTWSPSGTMCKGVTLNEEAFKNLVEWIEESRK